MNTSPDGSFNKKVKSFMTCPYDGEVDNFPSFKNKLQKDNSTGQFGVSCSLIDSDIRQASGSPFNNSLKNNIKKNSIKFCYACDNILNNKKALKTSVLSKSKEEKSSQVLKNADNYANILNLNQINNKINVNPLGNNINRHKTPNEIRFLMREYSGQGLVLKNKSRSINERTIPAKGSLEKNQKNSPINNQINNNVSNNPNSNKLKFAQIYNNFPEKNNLNINLNAVSGSKRNHDEINDKKKKTPKAFQPKNQNSNIDKNKDISTNISNLNKGCTNQASGNINNTNNNSTLFSSTLSYVKPAENNKSKSKDNLSSVKILKKEPHRPKSATVLRNNNSSNNFLKK
jgi:hypothetical protein